LREHAHGRVVRRLERHAGARRVDRRLLGGQHDVVQRALRGREAAVRRERAGDVRRVAVELAGGVDQDQVAVARGRVAGRIVKHARVRAGRDDRPVRGRLRAVLAERVQQLGLEFVFADAGAARLHRAAMCERRDVRGARHDRQLVFVLHEPHVVEQRREVAQRIGRGDAARACARTASSQPASWRSNCVDAPKR
jgi:hypothetical protein